MTRQGAFAVGILFFAVVLVPAGHGRTDSEPAAAVRQAPIVAVTVSASTWRNRGRVSFPVEATIRRKLTSAGLAIAANPAEPADLVMKVAYRETKGREVGLGSSGTGTDIACEVVLEHPTDGEVGAFSIQASPNYRGLITAPYVDAVGQLESNPYFYFLGDLVREVGIARRDPVAALISALERHQIAEPASGVTAMVGQPNPADTMPPPEILYARQARQRAIDELGRLHDARAVPILTAFSADPDEQIRASAQSALETLGAAD